jgi:AcrR family transcriptional regulator
MPRDPRPKSGKLPSARPRQGTAVHAKGLERVESILEAATDTLVEEGHAGLTLRRVAQRAGLSVGNLQYYFPTKQDVVRALLSRYLEAATRRVKARVEAGGSAPRERLRRALDALLEDQESSRHCQLFAELWALAGRDSMVAEALAVFYAGFRTGVMELLHELAPNVTAVRRERQAALVVAFLEGLSLFRGGGGLRGASVAGLEQELRELLEAVLGDGARWRRT